MSPSASSAAPPSGRDLADLAPGDQRRIFWAYGFGDAGTGMAASLVGFYLFIFYTSAAGLPNWLAGLVLMLGRLWDAVNDPLVGWLSDRTRSRWGARLPWLFGCALPLGIAMSLMWWLPPGDVWVRFFFFLGISILANSLYTGVNLPYSALASELTTDTSLRTSLNTARFTGSILASLLGIVLGALLVQNHSDPTSYWRMGLMVGVIICIATLLCAWGLFPLARHCRQPLSSKGTTRRLLRRIVHNHRFVRVLALYLLLWCALQLMQTAALIFLPVVMHIPEAWSNWILLPFIVCTLLGLQISNRIAQRHGRIHALNVGGGFWIAACLAAMLLVPLDTQLSPIGSFSNLARLTMLLLTIVVLGLGASTAYLIPWALLPDAVDSDPERPAGLLSSWMVFGQKVCISFALFFFGQLMTLSGYDAASKLAQPDAALVSIRLCMGIIPAVMVLLGLIVMRRWRDAPPVPAIESAA